jgi:hypothetical protein
MTDQHKCESKNELTTKTANQNQTAAKKSQYEFRARYSWSFSLNASNLEMLLIESGRSSTILVPLLKMNIRFHHRNLK